MCTLRVLSVCLVWFAGIGAPCAAEEASPKRALLIGIDGLRFDALRVAKTPHLDGLIDGGCYADNCLILGARYRKSDTISGPGWSSILTGVWADKHGVHDNKFAGKKYEEYPHFFARLKQQHPDARTVSLVTWKPIAQYIVSSANVNRAFEDDSKDYARFDALAAAEAVKLMAEPNLTCMFLYFGQVDVTGHEHGFHPNVAPYRAAIERVDGLVGQALTAMRARATYSQEDWLVVVTSDHGGKGTGHGGGHEVPEILNSLLIVSGDAAAGGAIAEQTYIVDAPATVLAHLGVELQPAWQLDGRAVGLKPPAP